jgi:hypothetical protein
MFSTPQVNIYSEEIVLCTGDTNAAFARLVAAGARALSEPHDRLDGLRDEVVQRRR